MSKEQKIENKLKLLNLSYSKTAHRAGVIFLEAGRSIVIRCHYEDRVGGWVQNGWVLLLSDAIDHHLNYTGLYQK
jgi:hypothetical protein